jgi:hypothetical protein
MVKANKVQILEEAQAEILAALEYYRTISPALAKDLATNIRESIQEITNRPKAYPLLRAEYRKINIKRFPYKLVFRLKGKDLYVVAFAHHKRKPSYWKKR